ncbi:acyltransferase [Flavihumibacter fluvii]|uniref:acyltransferase n=1 Tax=Flavihumibacter fluvii TaxID=2838157 RepID=UPI001BDEB328|nr:acyltransferase [Flavihumibacter fluvii]
MNRIKFFLNHPTQFFAVVLAIFFPRFRFFRETNEYSDKITFNVWFIQKVLGFNRNAYWPMHHSSRVVGVENIVIGIDTNPGFHPGCYIQGTGKLVIGDYSRIGANTGLLSGNHSVYDHKIYEAKETIIGKYCWIGMNSVILPGVVLGDYTKVAAGSVVTKSFPAGYCIIGGNPAKIIKELDPDKVVSHKYKSEYVGYIPKNKFDSFRKKHLNS